MSAAILALCALTVLAGWDFGRRYLALRKPAATLDWERLQALELRVGAVERGLEHCEDQVKEAKSAVALAKAMPGGLQRRIVR